MPPKKTPTSSLSIIKLLANRVWYRSQAKTQRMRSGGPSLETPSTRPPSRLPLEVVETIIAYLIYDMRSLRVCSLTCYTWYIAAVPHLHRSLIIWDRDKNRKLPQFSPIQHVHRLGLLRLVEELRIYSNISTVGISKKLFDSRILRQFAAFTNVRNLKIGYLDISSFMPTIQRHFDHFLPTVKSLTLALPKGSNRQITFFVGLFQHLEDFMLHDDTHCFSREEPALVPSFIPPLGGRLVVWRLKKAGLLKDMIDSFGGIRFTHMNIFDVAETQLLLKAGAKTLRTLQLQQTDPRATSFISDFNLSRNKSLREIETNAASVDRASKSGILGRASDVLKYALSTIRSPVFSRVVFVYLEHDFCGVNKGRSSEWPHLREMSRDEKAEEASRYRRHFDTLREMHRVRDFQSELRASVWGPVEGYAMQVLEEAVAAERVNGRLDGPFSESLVTYNPHWDLRLGVFP